MYHRKMGKDGKGTIRQNPPPNFTTIYVYIYLSFWRLLCMALPKNRAPKSGAPRNLSTGWSSCSAKSLWLFFVVSNFQVQTQFGHILLLVEYYNYLSYSLSYWTIPHFDGLNFDALCLLSGTPIWGCVKAPASKPPLLFTSKKMFYNVPLKMLIHSQYFQSMDVTLVDLFRNNSGFVILHFQRNP